MKLYYHPASPNGRRAALAALQSGADVELAVVDFAKAEHKSEAYTKLNPNQKVPVLVDGDFTLWESNAIMQYLARKNPAARLVPTDDRGFADVLRWQLWTVAHFAPAVGTLNSERVIKPALGLGETNEEACARALPEIQRLTGILDRQLRGKKFLLGDTLTIADLSVACALMYRVPARVPLDDRPEVLRWIESIEALPAWQQLPIRG